MLPALAMGALSFGGSMLSGLGASSASKSQERRQAANNLVAERKNEMAIYLGNEARANLGRELMTIPEHESVQTLNYLDIPGFLAGAEKAGFNPVTWLNAGALSAYHSVQTVRNTTGHNAADAYKLMVPEVQQFTPNVANNNGSFMGTLGGALSAGASAFGTQFRADQSYDLQVQKMMMAEAMQGMGLSQGNGLSTALRYGGTGGGLSANGGVGSAKQAGGLSAIAGNINLPYPTKWKYQDDVTSTNPFSRLWVDGKMPDAETGEKRYGEPGEWLFATRNMINDTALNLSGRSLEDWGKAAGMNLGDYIRPGDMGLGAAVSRWWTSPTSAPSRAVAAAPGWIDYMRDNWRSNGILAN